MTRGVIIALAAVICGGVFGAPEPTRLENLNISNEVYTASQIEEIVASSTPGDYAAVSNAAMNALAHAKAEKGFTLWTIFRNGDDVTAQVAQPTWVPGASAWRVYDSVVAGDTSFVTNRAETTEDSVSFDWAASTDGGLGVAEYLATRMRLPTMADLANKADAVHTVTGGQVVVSCSWWVGDLDRELSWNGSRWEWSNGNLGGFSKLTYEDGWWKFSPTTVPYGYTNSVPIYGLPPSLVLYLDEESVTLTRTNEVYAVPTNEYPVAYIDDIARATNGLAHVSELAGKANTNDVQLTPVYSQMPTYSDEWTILRAGVDVTAQVEQPYWAPADEGWYVGDSRISGDYMEDVFVLVGMNSNELSWNASGGSGNIVQYTATRARTDIIGYTLGSQTNRLIQPALPYPTNAIPYAAIADTPSLDSFVTNSADGTEYQLGLVGGRVIDGTAAMSIGYNAHSKGNRAVSVGRASYASGYGAIALGNALATNSYAIAIGANGSDFVPESRAIVPDSSAPSYDDGADSPSMVSVADITVASDSGDIAIGKKAQALSAGGSKVAIGNNALASSIGSIALGNATASGLQTVAVGQTAEASGERAAAIGLSASAIGKESIAIGKYAASTGDYSIVLGVRKSNGTASARSASTAAAKGSVLLGSGTVSTPDTLQFHDVPIVRDGQLVVPPSEQFITEIHDGINLYAADILLAAGETATVSNVLEELKGTVGDNFDTLSNYTFAVSNNLQNIIDTRKNSLLFSPTNSNHYITGDGEVIEFVPEVDFWMLSGSISGTYVEVTPEAPYVKQFFCADLPTPMQTIGYDGNGEWVFGIFYTSGDQSLSSYSANENATWTRTHTAATTNKNVLVTSNYTGNVSLTGNQTLAGNLTITGKVSNGYGTNANGYGSHAEGHYTIAGGVYSHADGYYSNATNSYSYVWNGDTSRGSSKRYGSRGNGTYCLNPVNDLYGFFIGTNNFQDAVRSLLVNTNEVVTEYQMEGSEARDVGAGKVTITNQPIRVDKIIGNLRRYPLFIIDLNPGESRIWQHLELKATTNNFDNANADNMIFFTSTTCNEDNPGAWGLNFNYDWCRIYMLSKRTGDVRSWTRIYNTGELDGYAPSELAIIVDPTLFKRGQGAEWLYEGNNELVWSYVRIHYDEGETDPDGKGSWRPIMPVKWFDEIPKWADESPIHPDTTNITLYEDPTPTIADILNTPSPLFAGWTYIEYNSVVRKYKWDAAAGKCYRESFSGGTMTYTHVSNVNLTDISNVSDLKTVEAAQ